MKTIFNGYDVTNKLVSAKQATSPPNLVPFYPNVIMFDPDAPYPDKPSRFPFLHWLKLYGQDVVPYKGPAPPQDSAPHEYIIVAFKGPRHYSLIPKRNGPFDIDQFFT